MNILMLILLGVVSVYILFGLIIASFLQPQQSKTNVQLPRVSVILACRNEVDFLPRCLDSLAQLTYPPELLQVIIVDDNSQDNSAEIINNYCNRYAFFQSLYIQNKIKPGKAGAVLEGIAASDGEIICITDADCAVPATWIHGLLEGFDENIGMVGGYTLLDKSKDGGKLFAKIQSCDHLYLLGAAGALSAMGCPISWLGNNLAFRRQVYDDVGGYQKLHDSLVEDFALIKAVDSLTSWKINFSANTKSTVQSSSVQIISEYYNQRKRWASGISQARAVGIVVMVAAFATHLLQMISIFSLPLLLWLAALTAVMLIDLLILYRSSRLINRTDLLRYFILFELYYYTYTLLLPILTLFDRRINWKGRAYKKTGIQVPDQEE